MCTSKHSHPYFDPKPTRTPITRGRGLKPLRLPRATGVRPEHLRISNPLFLSVFPVFLRLDVSSTRNLRSDKKSSISKRGDVRNQKRKKRRGEKGPLKYYRLEKDKIRGPLVRLLWRAAAAGGLPRRWIDVWRPGTWQADGSRSAFGA